MKEQLPQSREDLTLEGIVRDVEGLTGDLFGYMDIAEDEIAAVVGRDPENADQYNTSFGLLVPTGTLISDLLYKAHCQEILARVVGGQDTRPGTDAEILGAFSQATHAAPAGRTLSLAYARLFRRVFPDQSEAVDQLEASVGRERYEGDVDELIAMCRKKLTMKERVKEEYQR